MKNTPSLHIPHIITAILFIPALLEVSSFDKVGSTDSGNFVIQDTVPRYHNGLFEGQSRAEYIYEPYWGKVQVKIKHGRISRINFMIRDSNLHETFDDNYKKHFEGNEEYIKQCINDRNGVMTYPKLLRKTGNIKKVDALTGATWSYNIFRASLKEALNKAVVR